MEVIGRLHAPAAVAVGEPPPTNFCVGGWVGSKSLFGPYGEEKISFPCEKSNPKFSAVQP
jgi:hypothetical protein